MKNSIFIGVKYIATANMQKLYLSEEDFIKVKDNRILIVDDVISTSKSLAALKKLV